MGDGHGLGLFDGEGKDGEDDWKKKLSDGDDAVPPEMDGFLHQQGFQSS